MKNKSNFTLGNAGKTAGALLLLILMLAVSQVGMAGHWRQCDRMRIGSTHVHWCEGGWQHQHQNHRWHRMSPEFKRCQRWVDSFGLVHRRCW